MTKGHKIVGVSEFFPDGNVAVIGTPQSFGILEELEKATSIRLAMAFCHLNGWSRFEVPIKKCAGDVYLLTGLDFFQTEPQLLRAWNRLSINRRFHPRLVTTKSGIFHPKVLIVSSPVKKFALVGSGNLSEGGLRTNIECFLYTDESTEVSALTKWFDEVFRNAKNFGEHEIGLYEPKYKNAHRAVAKIRREQRKVEDELTKRQKAFLSKWNQAVNAAKHEFVREEFKEGWDARTQSIQKIKTALHYPQFDFSRDEWIEFYKIQELGHLIPIYRDRVFRQEKRLKDGLRLLVDDSIPIQKRLTALLERTGKHHISGLSVNTVSKILAVHDPDRWPVYNSPVYFTLRSFDYQPPRRVGMSGRYLAFANLMQDFMKVCGAKDVCALDWFFYVFAKDRKGLKKLGAGAD